MLHNTLHSQQIKANLLMPSAIHFFGSRQVGVDTSATETGWRFGKGSVFIPHAEHPESKNAIANINAIMAEQKLENTHPGVILQSAYSNNITVVDEAFLADTKHKRDPSGRIVIDGDGLFTVLPNIPLMNKSGDAHAIIFESAAAVGIIVGAWKCLSEDIIKLMLNNFSKHNIPFAQITVHVGPGLGSGSFGIGKPPLDDLSKTFGSLLDVAVTPKPNRENPRKYYFNVLALMMKHAETFQFILNINENADTFDKIRWKQVKAEALAKNDPEIPLQYYQHCKFFSARLYVRADRLARRIARQENKPLPRQLAPLAEAIDFEDVKNASKYNRYSETGRCLNLVMRM
jgi:copper oxidase (laccase) domain-containing protein